MAMRQAVDSAGLLEEGAFIMIEQLAESKVQGKFPAAGVETWGKLLRGADDYYETGNHFDARTLDEVIHLLRTYESQRTKLIAGGIDVLRLIREKYLPKVPDTLVNIKNVPDSAYIKEEHDVLKIGALTRLRDIQDSELVKAKYRILAETAGAVGSPQIRNMATIAGSICQDIRCWYYRASKNYYHCWRKGGQRCFAVSGDNRWMFSIFGSPTGCNCYATCQSDMAITLTALDASIKTTQRSIPIERFLKATLPGNVLKPDEVITGVEIPVLSSNTRNKYGKFSIRRALDHPLVSVAGLASDKRVKVVVGGVFIKPHVVDKVAELLSGQTITEDLAAKAGDIAVEGAAPMSMNSWKIEVTRAMVKRTLLALTETKACKP